MVKEAGELSFSDSQEERNLVAEIPKEERKLFTQAYDKSLSDLHRMMGEGNIFLNPEYQREYVWDNKKASLLIESVLLNVPIPIVYMSEEGDGKWSVIDGLQRLNSIKRFFDNEFKLTGLEVFTEFNRRTFKDLEPATRRTIQNGIIRIILVFRDSNPEIKYDIFMRLNRGAVKLSEQELRNCLYRGGMNDRIKTMRTNPKFLAMLGLEKPHKRMADAEMVLRYLAVKNKFNFKEMALVGYPGNMKTFLNQYMEESSKKNEFHFNDLEENFSGLIEKVDSVFGKEAFRKIADDGKFDRIPNRGLYDAVMVCFDKFDAKALKDQKKIVFARLRDMLIMDEEFIDSVTTGTSERKKIEIRVRKFFSALNEILL